MKDHEIAHLVNKLRGIANLYAGTDQLRGRISECVVRAVRDSERAASHEFSIIGTERMPPMEYDEP